MAALDPERLAVWRSLMTSHALLTKALTEALEDERELPLPWFEVLNALQYAGGRVRVMDLAAHLVISPSSLSRQLNRIEDHGLIRRDRGLDDHRAVVAVLTREGRETWRRANTTYLRVAKKRFINRLSDTDVAALQRVFNKVTDP
ncbi:MAG: MarR family transcriptional regulator [Ilumatobacteraceae bacterium]